MTRIVFFLVAAALVAPLAGLAACSSSSPNTAAGKLNVVATFYPLFEAARQVGGDKAAVSNLTPAGTEPHDFEPTPRDITNLNKAKMVVYNDAGLEPWLERVLPDLKKTGTVLVDASRSADVLQMTDDPSKKVPDPHFWLDPVIMQRIVVAIRDAYVQVDSANKASYEATAAAYVAQLEALNKKYEATLGGYARRTIVVSHNAFTYLARRHRLDAIFISGLSPDAEPSAQDLVKITKLAKERGIQYIFFETLVNPRLAETVAREVGAQTLVLNPLEGLTDEELAAGKSYISVMEENLANLKTALEAQQ